MNSSTLLYTDSNHLHKRVLLIKRPPLVRSSSPTLKKGKSVRFCDNASLENVRLFLKTQMPKACKADPTCHPKYTYHLHTPNWPTLHPINRVQLEHVNLIHQDPYLFLLGTIAVSNLAFEKQVEIRYTANEWKTTQILQASYKETLGTWDRFQFKLSLNDIQETTNIQLAVKYTVANHDYWDNNQHKNYHLQIIPDIQFIELTDDSSDEESPPLSPTTPVDMNPLYFKQNNHLQSSSFIHIYDPSLKVIHT